MALMRDVVAIILMAAGTVLCVALSFGLFKIFPSISRPVQNIEKLADSAAKAAPNMAAASENMKEATGYLRDAVKDTRDTTPLLRLLGRAGTAGKYR